MKFLIALCLGVLAVQALPTLRDPLQDIFDDLTRDLEDLNRIATTEQAQALDQLGGELRSLDELSQQLIGDLGENLVRDAGILEQQVHDLEREAEQQRVDISECIGSQLEELTKLPEHHLGEAGICVNGAHAQAEGAINDGVRNVNEAIGPIELYWRGLEGCKQSPPDEQEICVHALQTEIINDKIQIPSKIHLAVELVLGHLEAEKPTLLLCVAGRVEQLNEEGGRIVGDITECAERLFPGPRPPVAKVSAQLQDIFDDLTRDLEDLNRIATTEQAQALDQLGGELRSLDELSQQLIGDLGENLVRDAGILEQQVHDLEREAEQQRVDISECIGSQLEELTKLPEHHLGEAGICVNDAHAQAEGAIVDGVRNVNEAIGPIELYWRRLDGCHDERPEEQELCIHALQTEILNDKIQIPSKIHLAVELVLGHLEAEKPTLLLCVAGRVERLNEEGGRIVGDITECAERLFPGPRPPVAKVSAQLQDIFDDLTRDLEDLNRIATTEQAQALDQLGGELRSLDELSQQLIGDLGENLVRDAGILEQQVHDLEREAEQQRVDISECIGSQLEELTKLPEHHLGEAGICVNDAHAQAEGAIVDGVRNVNEAIGPIELYWRRLDGCHDERPEEQELCVHALQTEILNDKIQIPSKIHLAVELVLGHLEAEKPTLLLCVAGRVERLNEEGGRIVGDITECAERLFPGPRPPVAKVSAQLQDIFDDLTRDLEDLNRIATTEQAQALDQLGGELRSLDELSQQLIGDLGENLVRDAGILEQQIHDLEREAEQQRVDISECIGSQLEELTKLPEHHLGEAGICVNGAHAQAEGAINDGVRNVNEAIGPIELYWRGLEGCKQSPPDEQEICVHALQTEIINDKIQIPSKIHLAVELVLGHLEAEKPTLLLCVAGRVERLNEEGGRIVGDITECAERLFPGPRPPVAKVSAQLQDIFDDLTRDLEDLNRIATTEQAQALDQLGGELRSLDELSQQLIGNLGENLVRDAGILEQQIHDLEREAEQQRVDISECIGSQLEELTKLPEHHLGEAGICVNGAHAQAEGAINDGVRNVNEAIGPIELYWRGLEGCKQSPPDEQEICVHALQTEIINDKIQIPSKIHLAVELVLGHLEAEKPTLLLCVAGRVERLNEEGGRIVGDITECAERLFPGPRPPLV